MSILRSYLRKPRTTQILPHKLKKVVMVVTVKVVMNLAIRQEL